MSLAIRPANPSDLDALVALEQGFPEEDRFSRRTWARLLKGNTITRVAESDGTIIGSGNVLLRKGLGLARLYSLSIAPEARGRGLARQLLAELEAAAIDANCTRMRLEVRAGNAAARALYDSTGYRVISLLDAYYPDGETAARMEKQLGPPEPSP